MAARMVIEARFCGPPGGGNGGYVAGLLARRIDGPAEVVFRRPIPLDEPLDVERSGDGFVLRDGETVLAEAKPASPDLEPPPAPAFAEAEAATRRFPRFVDHPIPHCFVCGIDRAEGDGLRIFPGPVERHGLVAAPWRPDPSLAGDGDLVRPEFLWAALDCAGAFAVNEPPRGLVLLGRLTARILGHVRPRQPCIVAGWPIADEGRKLLAGTALYSAAGAPIAVARATWVFVRGGPTEASP